MHYCVAVKHALSLQQMQPTRLNITLIPSQISPNSSAFSMVKEKADGLTLGGEQRAAMVNQARKQLRLTACHNFIVCCQ